MATTSTAGGPARAGSAPARTREHTPDISIPRGAVVLGVPDADLESISGAMTLALHEAEQRHVPLVVLHACGSRRELTPETSWADEKVADHGQRLVGLVASRLRRMGRFETQVQTISSARTAVDALLAASQSASLVVLQVRPRRHPHLAPGPGLTVRAVATHAACPVVALHGNDTRLDRRGIVVGIQEHGHAQAALRLAMEEAVVSGAPVTAVHAWDVQAPVEVPPTPAELEFAHDAAERLVGEAVAGLAEDYPTVELHRRTVRGPAADVLRVVASGAGLLVVARHGRSWVGFHTLGRTARALLHDAPCPVVLTPPSSLPRVDRSPLLSEVPIGTGY